MNSPFTKFRRLSALLVLILAALFLVFVFFATKNALDVWERLQTFPPAVLYGYATVIGLFIIASLWLAFRILRPRSGVVAIAHPEVSEQQLNAELAQAEERGIQTGELQQELIALNERKASGRIYIALFGDVSTGKSSIIKALLPEARIETSVRAGSTQEIREYRWASPAGDELVLSDLPGRNESSGRLETLIEEEARRAHLVVYVCDSDISRSQLQDISLLLAFNKPLILCFNKSDRLSEADKQQLEQRIRKRISANAQLSLVFVQSGGEEQIIRILPDGSEQSETRPRPARIEALATAIQDQIDLQADALNQLRDASVFVLIKQKLDDSTQAHRKTEAEKIILSSTRKAIFGALASVSPGSDLIIQGIIGSAMVKDLCKLYEVPVKELDIEKFFDFSQGSIRKTLPLALALAGNAMKAFPGIGTITGGLTHAFAYGLIFDALGRAVHKTLQQRGALKPAPAAISFGENMNQAMLSKAPEIAKLVFEQSRGKSA